MKLIFPIAILCFLVGCDPSQLVPQSAGLQVEPATGGGGNIEPAEIPIRVTVQVQQSQSPDIGQGQDHKLCVNCGCRDPFGDDAGSEVPQKPSPPRLPDPPQLGSQVNRLQSGYIQWTDSAGVQWNYPPGTTLIEGQVSACGQWQYRDGRMVDLRSAGVQSSRSSSGVRYQRECTDQGCFLRRVN